MIRRFTILIILGALAGGSASAQNWPGSSWAAPSQDRQQDKALKNAKTGRILPMAEIRQRLKGRYGGDMQDAFLHERQSGALEYEVIWMTRDNRLLRLIIDARDGSEVSSR